MGALAGFMFILLVLAVIVTTGFLLNRRKIRTQNDAFRRLASDHNGTALMAGFFDKPSARFNHDGLLIQVTLQSGDPEEGPFVQVETRLPEYTLRLRIFPESFATKALKLLGTQDIEIGRREFDGRFVIQGQPVTMVRDFLTDPVQDVLTRMHVTTRSMSLSINAGRLIAKSIFPVDNYNLRQWTRLALELIDASRPMLLEGIEFLESSTGGPAAREPAICQICGEPVDVDIVECPSCRTPHHADCWDYFGSCSTFGCGQTRCRRVTRLRFVPKGT